MSGERQDVIPREHVYRRYVALGDSFTEGLNDEIGSNGRHRGWADRFASALNDTYPGLLYANLAVRGKLLGQVVDEQVPAARALEPDLVTFAAGVNDALRRDYDLDTCIEQLDRGVGALSRTGATVIVFAFGDPSRRSRVMGTVSTRLRAYNVATREVADRYGAVVVDFWGAAVFDDDVFWSADRLHLSPEGHALAARAALAALGLDRAGPGHAGFDGADLDGADVDGAGVDESGSVEARPDDAWRTPLPSSPPPGIATRAWGHARWAGGHFVPWLGRRLRGVSSGDGITAKRPRWEPVDTGG